MVNSVADLIRAARNGRTQAEFATVLGVSQSQLSRYERGEYDPPAKVINACMREAHIGNGVSAPSADDLARRVRTMPGQSAMPSSSVNPPEESSLPVMRTPST